MPQGAAAEDRGDEFLEIEDRDVEADPDDEAADDAGDDTVDGGAGDDTAKGAAGDDTVKGAAEDKKDEDKGIPRARFNEAVKKERDRAEAAEARLREAEEARRAAESAYDPAKADAELSALEEKLDQAVADGDKAAVSALRQEIREKSRAAYQAEAKREAAYQAALAVEQIRFDAEVARMEAEYPVLNPDGDEYSQEMSTEILELKSAYEAKGLGSTEALRKAANYVLRANGVEPLSKRAAAAPKKEDAEDKVKAAEAAAAEAAKARAEAARKKGAAAAAAQPPASVGAASDKKGGALDAKAVTRMTDADFDKLSEEDKKRMRGD